MVTAPANAVSGLPNPSRAVTWIDGFIGAPADVVEGCTVKLSANAAAAFTVTVSVCARATPLTVADTTFVPAPVELSVPIATPAEVVGPVGWVRAFPVPVAAMMTAAPPTGFPNASRAVKVTVAAIDPLLAVMAVGDVTSDDCCAETEPATIVNVPEVAPVSPGAEAASEYPAPALSTLKPGNGA